MNDTYELYKNGGSLVDECNKFAEDDMSIRDRKRLVEQTPEYKVFIESMLALSKHMDESVSESAKLFRDVFTASANCRDQITQRDMELLERMMFISQSRAEHKKNLAEFTLYFGKKFSRLSGN